MKIRDRIVFKIVCLTGTIFILMTGILTALVFAWIFRTTTGNIETSLDNRIRMEANAINGTIFAKIGAVTENYAALVSVMPLDGDALLEEISPAVMGSSPLIVGGGFWLEYYTIADSKLYGPYWFRDGEKIRLTWEYSNEKNDYTKFDWYLNDGIASGRKVVWSEPYNDAVTKVPMITATSALVHGGKKIGVVTLDIGLAELTGYLDSIKISEIGDYSLSLLTRDGVCVAGDKPEQEGKQLYALDGSESGPLDLGDRLVIHAPIADSGLAIALEFGKSEISAPVTRVLFILVAVAAALQGLAFFLIVIILRRIVSKPIGRTIDTLKEVFDGDTTDLTKRLGAASPDEIGEMERYFNKALEKMRHLITAIKTQTEQLSGIGEDLSENMGETAAALGQINANIQSVKKQTVNQSASVTETDATMRQIASAIEQLDAHIDSQADTVSQSSSAIEEMLANISSVTQTLMRNAENVKELALESDHGRNDLNEVSERMREIARESEGLLEISSVIESVASQTTLLAMNAAIEAAHAGDAGKGFAVVSDEIRKLAESSGSQAKTVSTVLKRIRDSMNRTTDATNAVQKQFDDINSRLSAVSDREKDLQAAMNEQNEGSKEILKGTEQLNDITSRVKAGSEEMLGGSREVIEESGNLSRITQEVNGSMNEMAAGVEQISRAMNKVNDLSRSNKESIDALSLEVRRFRVD